MIITVFNMRLRRTKFAAAAAAHAEHRCLVVRLCVNIHGEYDRRWEHHASAAMRHDIEHITCAS